MYGQPSLPGAGSEAGGNSGSAGRVLIVDDYETTRDTFVRLLELDGYLAEAVETGNEAIDRATTTDFDVILCDLRLPDISGLEVLSQLKDRGVTSPIIIVTRFPDVESSFEAGARGAAGFIAGMLIGDELSSVVNRAIRGLSLIHLPDLEATDLDPTDVEPRPLHGDHEIRRLLELFEADPSLSPKALASMLGIGESTLRSRFRNCMKVPLGKFLADRRLEVAARLLLSSSDRVQAVAAHVGISDARYFRKVFRRRFGLPPTDYRTRFSK